MERPEESAAQLTEAEMRGQQQTEAFSSLLKTYITLDVYTLSDNSEKLKQKNISNFTKNCINYQPRRDNIKHKSVRNTLKNALNKLTGERLLIVVILAVCLYFTYKILTT